MKQHHATSILGGRLHRRWPDRVNHSTWCGESRDFTNMMDVSSVHFMKWWRETSSNDGSFNLFHLSIILSPPQESGPDSPDSPQWCRTPRPEAKDAFESIEASIFIKDRPPVALRSCLVAFFYGDWRFCGLFGVSEVLSKNDLIDLVDMILVAIYRHPKMRVVDHVFWACYILI